MKKVRGGVTSPRGFRAGAVSCGIKRSGKKDLALLVSDAPCAAAGVFTVNRIRSGSVAVSEKHLKKGLAQALVVNSGNANACVGEKGIRDAERIVDGAAGVLSLPKGLVLIASTGIIGKALPVARIEKKLPLLAKGLRRPDTGGFAKAIMTTDTVQKEFSIEIKIGAKPVRIGGAAKGSGMISPHMATMLAFFTTDALIEKAALKKAFKESVSDSFNKITVDGDMSTNDTAIIFANGLAGNKKIKAAGADYRRFLGALKAVSRELARKIVLDGEGATRFVEIVVKNSRDTSSAEKIARHVACSSLIKTMIAGGDPNWGRVAASIGSSGAKVDGKKIDIYFGRFPVMKGGCPAKAPRKALLEAFRKKEIRIVIDLKSGSKSGWMWTCDLTKTYVEINSEYEI